MLAEWWCLADDFLDELGFEGDGDAVHFAGNFVVAVLEADAVRFGASLENLGTALEFEVFDHLHDVTFCEEVAVSVFDDAGILSFDLFSRFWPFVTTCHAFVFFAVFDDVVDGADRAR